jgi:hypothetical protein
MDHHLDCITQNPITTIYLTIKGLVAVMFFVIVLVGWGVDILSLPSELPSLQHDEVLIFRQL